LVSRLVIWGALTAGLVLFGISLDLVGHMLSHLDMLLGMGLGITTAPIMMAAIKGWRTRRKINRMLNEIVQERKGQKVVQETEGLPTIE